MLALLKFVVSPLGRAIALGVLVAVLVGVVAFETSRLGKLSGQVAAAGRCTADLDASTKGGFDEKKLMADCPATSLAAAQVVAKATLCDQAIGVKPRDAYGMRAACSTQVMTLDAERQAAADSAATLQTDLNQLQAGQSQAIARAEDRARTEAERTARAQAAVAKAPVDSSGLTVCDADCLRARWSRPDGTD